MNKNFAWAMHQMTDFGFLVALSTTLNKVYKYGPHTDVVAYSINKWKHTCIKKSLKKKYKNIIGKYKNCKNSNVKSKSKYPEKIWTIWWQGEDKAPDAVKLCYQSMRKYSGGHEVIVISKDNYSNYISLPDYILQKASEEKISFIHLADIIRMNLLYHYGGLWLDATIFFTDVIDQKIFSMDYFTGKLHRQKMACVSEGRWNGTFFAGKPGNVFFDYMLNFYYEYWKNENQVIDYFLIDYMTDIAYDELPAFRRQYEMVEYNNKDIFKLNKYLNDKFNFELFNRVTIETRVHKLQRRSTYSSQTKNGELTFYGYIEKQMYSA